MGFFAIVVYLRTTRLRSNAIMTREERRRALQQQLRDSHRRLFDPRGNAIAGLREALNTVSRTHDEMMALFEPDNGLEDPSNEEGRT